MLAILISFGLDGLVYILFKRYVNKNVKYCFWCPMLFSIALFVLIPIMSINKVADIKPVRVELEKVNGQYYNEDVSNEVVYYYKNGKKMEASGKVGYVKYEGDIAYMEYYEYDVSKFSVADKVFWFPTYYIADYIRCFKDVVVVLPESEK